MKNLKKINFKSQKGAVTLYVLMAMLFFSAFLTGIYIMNVRKEAAMQEYVQIIQEHYNLT